VTAAPLPIIKTPVVELPGLAKIIYALQPKQYEAYKLTPLYLHKWEPYPSHLGYGGASFGGKSLFARCVLAATALRWPGSTSILFRKTEREVVANHVNKFRSEFPSIIEGRQFYKYNANDLLIHWFNESRTYFGYLRNDDDVFTYQGPEYDVMVFEEATHYSHFQVNWLASNRLRATVNGARPFALYPSNPGGQGHFWYKRWFIERRFHVEDGERPEDFAFVQAKCSDNAEGMARDPAYMQRLDALSEPWRSWMRDGDFSAGAGTALVELNRDKHLIPPFAIPPHWPVFGSFDWGYNHPFAFGFYAVSEDGVRFKIDTVTGRRLLPHEIAERVKGRMSQLRIPKLAYICAGHDAWAQIKARGEMTPTIADTFADMGLPLIQANIDRKMGLQELRRAFAWKTTGPNQTAGEPMLRFFDTETNRRCFEQLETRVTDRDDPEDILKTNADEWGEGGDDMVEETRYAIASRPSPARSTWGDGEFRAWDPSALAAERDRLTRGRGDKVIHRRSEESWEEMP
jgi:phage terminase large subunit